MTGYRGQMIVMMMTGLRLLAIMKHTAGSNAHDACTTLAVAGCRQVKRSAGINHRYTNLCNKGNDEDADKQRVAVHAGENVVFSVDLTRTDLIEECHHDQHSITRHA